MTYAEYQQMWLGTPIAQRRVDYDGFANYQCVDLIKDCLDRVYGIKPGSWGNAIDYWYHTNPAIFAKFRVVTGTLAKAGDIVVFETNRTPIIKGKQPGHIALATGNQTATAVEVLEQNGSTGGGSGTGGDAIRTRYISKSRIAGILRPLTSVPGPSQAMPPIGSVIKLAPGTKRTTFRAGSTVGAGVIYARDDSYSYEVRGYDPVFKNRILINSKSAGGDGVGLALFYTDGKRIDGWTTI